MTRKYIYGIIPANRPLSFGVWNFPPQPEQVYTVVHQGLGCVVSNYSGADFASLTKEEQIRCLMAHQAVIERVMIDCPILPVKFGALVEGNDEVRCLIGQGRRTFAEALARLDGKVEMEVAATWDLQRVLQEIGQQEEIMRLKAAMADRPAAEALEQGIRAGRIVKESLDRRREEYQQRMLESLRGMALDVQPNALVVEEMVMNVAFLIQREREEEFDKRVRELDQVFQDQINFRVIGPLPPYSFATVEPVRPNAVKIEEARRLLGLGVEITEAEVKQAYRRLAAATHPDAHPEGEPGHERFARVREAFDLLNVYCWAQNQPGEQRYSLAPQDVSQAFLITVKRATAQVV